jgi:GTPase SAR1 family protein
MSEPIRRGGQAVCAHGVHSRRFDLLGPVHQERIAKVRVLWLFGAPGVGKSTAAWRLYEEWTRAGVRCGYVDIDQLGMCYPSPDDDPDRHRLKGSVLAALLPNYAAGGAQVLVVSGVLNPALARWLRAELAGAEVTFCRLVLAEEKLRHRIAQRGGDEFWEDVRRIDGELDAAPALGPTVVTDGLDPGQVAAAVDARAGVLAGASPVLTDAQDRGTTDLTGASTAPGTVVWLCGTTAVGKSTLGWQLFTTLQRQGRTAAFLDLRQLSFISGAARTCHRLASANVAAAWERFSAAGATHLILSGAVESRDLVQLYRAALPATTLTVYRLRAGRQELARRVQARGRGQGARLAGDWLLDQPQEVCEAAARQAWHDQTRVDAVEVGDALVDVTGVSPADFVSRVLTTLG